MYRLLVALIGHIGCTVGLQILAGIGGVGCAIAAEPEWSHYGGNTAFQRYSPLDQIYADNVHDLQIVWHHPAIDERLKVQFPDLTPGNYLHGTPIIANGLLYVSDGVGLVEAIDPTTGKTVWVQKPLPSTFRDAASGSGTRGVEYWSAGRKTRIFAIRGEFLYSIDAKSGDPDLAFGDRGKVFLRWPSLDALTYHCSAGPIVVNNVVVVGGTGGSIEAFGSGDYGDVKEATPEDIRGYDANTGHLLWTFHVIPTEDDPEYKTWGKGSADYVGNIGSWAPMSGDEKLGYVYIPLSAPTVAFYGGHRPGNNLYANSLVVLNVKTGTLVWHFQMVHHDLWDYDNASPPILGEITVGAKRIRAVMQANKTGFLYVFDRVTGKPVWPIEERPVPQSTVPGEATSPTQPIPTKPPAFDRQGLSEADLIDFTPELRAEAQAIANQYVLGPLFTPPSLVSDAPGGKKGSLVVPGGTSGAGNWNTGAFDPDTGMYYAVSRTEVNAYGVKKVTNPEGTIAYTVFDMNPPAGEGYTLPPGPNLAPLITLASGLPLVKPPYGRITAYDLNRGDVAWTAAHGPEVYRNNPALKGLNLPLLGYPERSAPLLTKTLLFLGDASISVENTGIAGKAKFKAYDKTNGRVIWEHEIPVGVTAAPMTYMANGSQYIVVGIGGPPGDDTGWTAFALKH